MCWFCQIRTQDVEYDPNILIFSCASTIRASDADIFSPTTLNPQTPNCIVLETVLDDFGGGVFWPLSYYEETFGFLEKLVKNPRIDAKIFQLLWISCEIDGDSGQKLTPAKPPLPVPGNPMSSEKIMILVNFDTFFSFLGGVPAEGPYGSIFLSTTAERQKTQDFKIFWINFRWRQFFSKQILACWRRRESVWSSVLNQLKAARDRCAISFTWFCSIFSLGG